MPGDQATRRLPSREPSLYDNAIHGRPDYEDRLYDDEPDEDVATRTRILDAIATATPGVKAAFIRALGTRRVAQRSGAGSDRAPGPSAVELRNIRYHGNKSYSVEGGSRDPVTVTYEEDKVLQAFMESSNSMGRAELENRAVIGNAPRAMKLLAERYGGRFATAIRRPGRKGVGGYFARVVPFLGSVE